jgi:hypothetical protein
MDVVESGRDVRFDRIVCAYLQVLDLSQGCGHWYGIGWITLYTRGGGGRRQ